MGDLKIGHDAPMVGYKRSLKRLNNICDLKLIKGFDRFAASTVAAVLFDKPKEDTLRHLVSLREGIIPPDLIEDEVEGRR